MIPITAIPIGSDEILTLFQKLITSDAVKGKSVDARAMPNLSAAVVCKQLARLDEFNEKRIINAERFTNQLSDIDKKEVKLPKMSSNAKSTFTRYVIRVNTGIREHLIDELLKRGVGAQRLYSYIKGLLPEISTRRHFNAEALSDSFMMLPNHPLLTDADIEAISSAFLEALEAI